MKKLFVPMIALGLTASALVAQALPVAPNPIQSAAVAGDDAGEAVVEEASAPSAPQRQPVLRTKQQREEALERIRNNESNVLDEIDPRDPNIEAFLRAMDQDHDLNNPDQLAWSIIDDIANLFQYANTGSCSKATKMQCTIYAEVSRASQTLKLYKNGGLIATWKVSTGKAGTSTPAMELHPNGRIYKAYTSKKFPGGDYNGLGNMPYAVFLRGGYAIHGTGTGNWSKLGRPASHGCIRLHPNNAKIFNAEVRAAGIRNVWVSVK